MKMAIIPAGLTIFFFFVSHAAASEYQAALDWSQRVELSTPVSGVVKKILVDVGDTVPKNAVLLILDDREFQAKVNEAQAEVASKTALRDEAKRELERSEELYERTILSDHDLQLARIGFKKAQASYQGALKQMASAKMELEYSTVRAPLDAIVIKRNANVGETVASSMQPPVLFVVADSQRMLARTIVKASEISGLKVGHTASVSVGDLKRSATLSYIGFEPLDQVDGRSSYEVIFVFPTEGAVFRKGQLATVKIP